jgi:hypothetical protein
MTNFERITKNGKQLAEFLARSHRELLALIIEDGGKISETEYEAENADVWLEWLGEKYEIRSEF